MAPLIEAYDTNTGDKLAQLVPEEWLTIFPHLSRTPSSKSALPHADWTIAELREHADSAGIDLGSARTKAEILDALAAAESPNPIVAFSDQPAGDGQNQEA